MLYCCWWVEASFILSQAKQLLAKASCLNKCSNRISLFPKTTLLIFVYWRLNDYLKHIFYKKLHCVQTVEFVLPAVLTWLTSSESLDQMSENITALSFSSSSFLRTSANLDKSFSSVTREFIQARVQPKSFSQTDVCVQINVCVTD